MAEKDGAPAGGEAVFDLNKIADDATTTVKINDRDVVLKVKDLPKLAAMGYRFSERMQEVQDKERDIEAKAAALRQEVEKEYEPERRLRLYLDQNPDKKTAVRMVVNDEGRVVPMDDNGNGSQGTNAIDLAQVEDRITRKVRDELVTPILERFGKIEGGFGALSERASEQAAIDYLRANPSTKDLATDNNIAMAREHKRKVGGDLITAFKNVTYEDAMAMARSRTIEQYGIDTENSELPGSRPPVIGNLTLDEKTYNKLFGPDADPDDLAQHAKEIRAHRKKMSGKTKPYATSRR